MLTRQFVNLRNPHLKNKYNKQLIYPYHFFSMANELACWALMLFEIFQLLFSVDASHCTNELGCFPITPDFINPILRPINVYPWNPRLINTRFYLFTRNLVGGTLLKSFTNRSSHPREFMLNKRLKILIPGWLDNKLLAKWLLDVKDAFLFREDCNVIITEWNNFTPYFIAVANARVVGAEIARLLDHLEV